MPIATKLDPRSEKYQTPTGYDVFHWPEFQALARRLLIDLEAPIREVTINIPVDGIVTITTETLGLDENEER